MTRASVLNISFSAPSEWIVRINTMRASELRSISVHPASGPCVFIRRVQVVQVLQCTQQADHAHSCNTCEWVTHQTNGQHVSKWRVQIVQVSQCTQQVDYVHETRASRPRISVHLTIKQCVSIWRVEYLIRCTSEWIVRISTTRASALRT